jgi:hypothetical protein
MNTLFENLPELTEADMAYLCEPLAEDAYAELIQINDEDLARLCEPLDDENKLISYSTDHNTYDDLPILNIFDLDHVIESMECDEYEKLTLQSFLNKPYDDFMDYSTHNDEQQQDDTSDSELDDYLKNWPKFQNLKFCQIIFKIFTKKLMTTLTKLAVTCLEVHCFKLQRMLQNHW